MPRSVRVVQVVTGAVVLLYLASTILRSPGSYSTFYDVWVANLGYAGCTTLCIWRAIARRPGRWGWGALAAGLLLFTAGSVLWTSWVQFFYPVPYPSIADVCFLAFFFMAFIGIGLLVRETLPKTARTIWVDALIAALGVAAVEAMLVIGPIWQASKGDFGTVATNIAYPIGDLVLVTMIVAVFAVRGWRPGRLWWTLGMGLVIFAAADSVYVLRVTSGKYVTGTPLDSLWLIGAFLIVVAAWQGLSVQAKHSPMIQPPVIVPALFVLSSLGIVVYAAAHPGQFFLGVALATTTLVIALARSAYAFRQVRALADSKREARTDELTGLPNRRLFFERLLVCFEPIPTPHRLAVLMIDLDRFKEINDSLGHHVGDDVLRELGPRLVAAAGSTGTVARLGGDEFGMVLSPLVDMSEATEMAERVREVLRAPFELEGMSLRVDASIGIALAPDHGTTPESVLQKADVAMFAAKRAHAPWQIYSSDHDQNALDRLELMEDLRDAIHHGEIVPFYQPILDLRTGSVMGAEALARWLHPSRGILAPAAFLNLVSDAGLMGPFTMAVLDQAFVQQARWYEQGYDLGVSVNISAASLRDEELPEKIATLMSTRGVDPARVTLEITEDCFIANPEEAVLVLERLRDLGAHLAIDDFGTGFSSLTYMRRLPVSELKLDRTFLSGAPQDERAVSVIRSTVDLAHSLGLRIVAEGIENLDALALVDALGCDAAQGYLMGRPVPAEEFDLGQVAVLHPREAKHLKPLVTLVAWVNESAHPARRDAAPSIDRSAELPGEAPQPNRLTMLGAVAAPPIRLSPKDSSIARRTA
ncbi:MAG: EAL domain-containing protein [Candidatus Dormiibacterota bacterium]